MKKEDKKLIEDARVFLKSITYIAWPDDKTYQRFMAIALRFEDRVFEADMVDGEAEKDGTPGCCEAAKGKAMEAIKTKLDSLIRWYGQGAHGQSEAFGDGRLSALHEVRNFVNRDGAEPRDGSESKAE